MEVVVENDQKITMAQTSLLLPSIVGVRPLSRSEIKKDLREMETFDQSDTEGSSVTSDEVVASFYPVKPRKVLKISSTAVPSKAMEVSVESDKAAVNGDDDAGFDDMTMEETLDFLTCVETNRKDIYEAEKTRENLEIKYQSLRDNYVKLLQSHNVNLTEKSNFIYALNELTSFYYNLDVMLNNRNQLTVDAYCILQRYLNSIQYLDGEIQSIKNVKSSKNKTFFDKLNMEEIRQYVIEQNTKLESQSHHVPGTSTSTLAPSSNTESISGENRHINAAANHLSGIEESAQEICLYKTQILGTPYGIGEIIKINSITHMISIQMRFGVMYSHIDTVAYWIHYKGGDYVSKNSIKLRWKEKLETMRKFKIDRHASPATANVVSDSGGDIKDSKGSSITSSLAPQAQSSVTALTLPHTHGMYQFLLPPGAQEEMSQQFGGASTSLTTQANTRHLFKVASHQVLSDNIDHTVELEVSNACAHGGALKKKTKVTSKHPDITSQNIKMESFVGCSGDAAAIEPNIGDGVTNHHSNQPLHDLNMNTISGGGKEDTSTRDFNKRKLNAFTDVMRSFQYPLMLQQSYQKTVNEVLQQSSASLLNPNNSYMRVANLSENNHPTVFYSNALEDNYTTDGARGGINTSAISNRAKSLADLQSKLKELTANVKESESQNVKAAFQLENYSTEVSALNKKISSTRLGLFTRRVLRRQYLQNTVSANDSERKSARITSGSAPKGNGKAAQSARAKGSRGSAHSTMNEVPINVSNSNVGDQEYLSQMTDDIAPSTSAVTSSPLVTRKGSHGVVSVPSVTVLAAPAKTVAVSAKPRRGGGNKSKRGRGAVEEEITADEVEDAEVAVAEEPVKVDVESEDEEVLPPTKRKPAAHKPKRSRRY